MHAGGQERAGQLTTGARSCRPTRAALPAGGTTACCACGACARRAPPRAWTRAPTCAASSGPPPTRTCSPSARPTTAPLCTTGGRWALPGWLRQGIGCRAASEPNLRVRQRWGLPWQQPDCGASQNTGQAHLCTSAPLTLSVRLCVRQSSALAGLPAAGPMNSSRRWGLCAAVHAIGGAVGPWQGGQLRALGGCQHARDCIHRQLPQAVEPAPGFRSGCSCTGHAASIPHLQGWVLSPLPARAGRPLPAA